MLLNFRKDISLLLYLPYTSHYIILKPHAIALSCLGVQAPTEEVHVVLEVPPEVNEGMYNYFYALS